MNRVADVDIRLLRVFNAVVEAGGYAAAQAKLDVGTSTISLHMSDLEKRIGFSVCKRGRGGFSLTERGALVYEQTKRLLNSLDDFSSSLSSLRRRLTGRLRIGMVDSLITHPQFPMIRAIQNFNKLDNGVTIELEIEDRVVLERRVLNHDLHAAISPFVKMIEGLTFQELIVEKHKIYCGQGHRLYGCTEPIGDLLCNHPFVLRSHHGQADMERFAQMNVRATVNNMEGMLILIATGNYVGLLPDHLAKSWVERGDLWPLDAQEYEQRSSHSLVTSNARNTSSAAAALIPHILSEASAPWQP